MSRRGGEVGVVGYAARLPGARNANEFWSLLRDNRCAISWITPDRFPTQEFYHPSPDQAGKSYTFAAGLIDDIWGFDAGAFGMSPREAEQVDPQQRQLLEVTQDALAHAGIRPSSLAGTNTGVYVGASSVDYGARFFADPSSADVHMMTGNTLSIIANRLSYSLNLHGPSFTVDTACSSSLVALCLAADAIRNQVVDTAIVAGVNLLLSPFSFVGFSRASMLSPTGLCRPFDAAADGYVRAEGVAVLVLRSMAAARSSRNKVRAAIMASGVGQDGRTTGLSLPSADSQKRLLDQVYSDFSIDPLDLSFVEAHGTGTRVGDPIEADALGRALGQHRSQPLMIGSVKSNIGHLEPASGLAGVLKSIIAMERGILPATLHQNKPNSDIAFDELNLRVVDRNQPLPLRRNPHLVGVNSFGFGGTNAHVVLRGDDAVVSVLHRRTEGPLPPLLLNAHSKDGLQKAAAVYGADWPSERHAVRDHVAAAAYQRDLLPHRALIRGDSPEELKLHVEQFAADADAAHTLTAAAIGSDLPVALLFSGNGSQWAGMGCVAWQSDERFRDALRDVDERLGKRLRWSVVDMLNAPDLVAKLRMATFAQPMILALQIATVRSLEAAGLHFTATLGHSVGEIAAAWASGHLGVDQALDIVVARSRHQEQARGAGTMAALMLGEGDARRLIEGTGTSNVEIAAVNSWRSVTVSGPVSEIEQLVAAATEKRIGARQLDLDYPFHSALVDPVRAPLLRELAGLNGRSGQRRLISSVTGAAASRDLLTAEHWWRNVREPVRFAAGLQVLLDEGHKVFVEVGPRPILTSYVRDTMRNADVRGAIVETLTESSDGEFARPIERAVSRVLLSGGQVDFGRFFGPPPAESLPQPAYPWAHTAYRVRPTTEASGVFAQPGKCRLLGQRTRADSHEWFSTVDTLLFPWISDHTVGGSPVFPATAYVEMMLGAGREVYASGAVELRDLDIFRPLILEATQSFETLVRVSADTGIADFLSRPRGAVDWALNARAVIRQSPVDRKQLDEIAPPLGTVVVPKPKVYEAAASLGFGYGPRFRRARHVKVFDGKRAEALLDKPAPDAMTYAAIDIAGFDAAFHALFAGEEAGVADIPMTRMLPVRFGQVRLFAPGRPVARAICRTLRRTRSSTLVDIDLVDEDGEIILAAEGVRLIEAPAAAAADARSLSYRTRSFELDRARVPANPLPAIIGKQKPEHASQGHELAEGLMLLEAGCLRAAWSALQQLEVSEQADAAGLPEWVPFLRSALLWHLETRGLASERYGRRVLAEECELPDVASLVRSVIDRHPTMAGEAAELARLDLMLVPLLRGEEAAATAFASVHRRELNVSARPIVLLRNAVLRDIELRLEKADRSRLFRVLMLGAEQAVLAADLVERFDNLEILITDTDSDRIDQARASLSDEVSQVSCLTWAQLDQVATGTVDMLCAVDSLSELATTRAGLLQVTRLLRPNAPVLAGELAPSIFWDLVRGTDAGWWARSTAPEFPVGALLTPQEWADELASAGFGSVDARPFLGEDHCGMIVRAVAPDHQTPALAAPLALVWDGCGPDTTALFTRLAPLLGFSAEVRTAEASADAVQTPYSTPAVTSDANATADHVFAIDGRQEPSDAKAAALLLDGLSKAAQRSALHGNRFWIVVDFDSADPSSPPSARPLWTMITSASRVAQNELSNIEIRCIGVAGSESRTAAEHIVEEIRSASDEREIFLQGDKRLVFRLERGATEAISGAGITSTSALALSPRDARGRMAWVQVPRTELKNGEVEIAVEATGLNFRDVMWNLRLLPEEALEDGFAGPTLGMECAGVVSRVAGDVKDFGPGDRVVAFTSSAFASHTTAPSFAVCRLPDNLSFEAAATLPVAFLTAYYSLIHLARLKAGETVLIHGGAGAVGLAALQIAQRAGAFVIATAGTEEKRALLRSLGADGVFNSRSLGFADEILASGRSVNVVLNSLAGEAVTRSLDCLRPFGRFVELGKRDFYGNTHIGLRPFRRNLTYFGVDVDQLLSEDRELVRTMFTELMDGFAEGNLLPLAHRVFSGDHIENAFRLMQRSGHIGKIVVRPPSRAGARTQQDGKFPVDTGGVHLIVGGTSGFGVATVEWLVDRGARHFILASRTGRVSDEAQARVALLRERGISLEIVALDVCNREALTACLARDGRRIRGIVHAAMTIEDGLLTNLDQDAIARVMKPKLEGARLLDELTRGMKLDYFLLYSSATTMLGNPGQYNYVAANAYLEGLAQRRFESGLPGLAVAWGAIEDTGYLARNIGTNPALRRRFATSLIASRQALEGLDWAFDEDGRQLTGSCVIGRIDWSSARKELATVRSPAFAAVMPISSSRPGSEPSVTIEKLRAMPPEQAAAALLDIMVEEIARVLRLGPKEVDRYRPLGEIGMDSLMMLELRTTVEESLGIELPIMSLANGISAADVARRLVPLLSPNAPGAAVPGNLRVLGGSHLVQDVDATTEAAHVAAAEAVLRRSRTLQEPI